MLMSRSSDDYMRERVADIRDVVERLTSYLSDALRKNSKSLDGPVIVVADELLPSQVVMPRRQTCQRHRHSRPAVRRATQRSSRAVVAFRP